MVQVSHVAHNQMALRKDYVSLSSLKEPHNLAYRIIEVMGVRTTGSTVTTLIAKGGILTTFSANLFDKTQIHTLRQVQSIHIFTLKVYFLKKPNEYYHKYSCLSTVICIRSSPLSITNLQAISFL